MTGGPGPPSSTLFRRLLVCVSTVAAFWTPVLATFHELGLPLTARPSLILFGGIGMLGLAMGGAAACLMPRGSTRTPRHLAFAAVLGGIVAVTVDLVVGGHRVLDVLTPQVAPAALAKVIRLGVLTVLLGVVIAVVYWLRRHVVTLLVLCSLSAFFVTGVAVVWPHVVAEARTWRDRPEGRAVADKPPVLYLVVDEAMGVDGVRHAPGGEAFAALLLNVFERHGFRLHEKSFSRHFVSARSIPNTLNFDYTDDSYGPILRHQEDGTVQSLLFQQLADDGYEVISYMTRHIDFCFESASRCEVLPSFNPFSPFITNEAMRASALYELVRYSLAESYVVYHYTTVLSVRQDPSLPSSFIAFDAYAFPAWFDKFTDDVLSAPRGRAYFAHVLMPHSPFVLDESCSETGASTVAYFLAEQHRLSGEARDQTRRDAYVQYFQQYSCLLNKLDGLLTTIGERGDFDGATIVVHGDHGSRISAGQLAESLSVRDLIDNYSTLYAIRAPGVVSGRSSRQTSVQRLTAEYLGDAPRDDPQARPTVAVDSSQPEVVRVLVMPDAASIGQTSSEQAVEHVSDQ